MLKNGAVFLGRFNPPTIGHYNVIDKMKQYITSHKSFKINPIILIVIIDGVESGKDKSVNPLSTNERVRYMQSNVSCNDCKFIIAKDAIDGFNKVRDAGYEPVFIAGGSDRVDNYMALLENYDPTIKRYMFKVDRNIPKITDENAQGLLDSISADDVNMISASLARKAVELDNLQKFKMITGTEIGKVGERMFDKIKKAMGVEDESAT